MNRPLLLRSTIQDCCCGTLHHLELIDATTKCCAGHVVARPKNLTSTCGRLKVLIEHCTSNTSRILTEVVYALIGQNQGMLRGVPCQHVLETIKIAARRTLPVCLEENLSNKRKGCCAAYLSKHSRAKSNALLRRRTSP